MTTATETQHEMRGLPVFEDAQPVDVSPTDWDGSDQQLLDANGRDVRYVIPALADYVKGERELAGRMGEPVTEKLKQFAGALRGAAKPATDALAKVKAGEQRARSVNLSTEQANAVSGYAAVDRHHAREALRSAVEAKTKEYDEWLAKAEADAATRLATLPSTSPTPADISFAADHATSLQLIASPAIAAQVLARYMVLDVVNASTNDERTAALRRATALLPIARDLAERFKGRHGSYNDVVLVLRQHDVVSRDRDWYHAHRLLARARGARQLVALATWSFVENDGDEAALGAVALRTGNYRSLGFEPKAD